MTCTTKSVIINYYLILTVYAGDGSFCLELGALNVARRFGSMRRCWMSATLCFKSPRGLSLLGEYGFGRNHAPVDCQSTSLQVAKLYLENHFAKERTGRERMVRRRGNIAGCYDDQARE